MIWELDGIRPEIDASAWVAPDAQVMGRVRLGPGAGIWFGAVLRGDSEWIEIGEATNIQDGCVLHTDSGFPVSIGRDCTIGHRAVVHGCTIGPGTLIGMSATVLTGARIGAGCLVGAGALVTGNAVIPDGSLVMGAPGRVVRALDAAARAQIIESAAHYRANAERFRAGLKPA